MIESFWSTMQRELLDTQIWETPEELGAAIFDRIEALCNPAPAHRARMLSPINYEQHWERQRTAKAALHTADQGAA